MTDYDNRHTTGAQNQARHEAEREAYKVNRAQQDSLRIERERKRGRRHGYAPPGYLQAQGGLNPNNPFSTLPALSASPRSSPGSNWGPILAGYNPGRQGFGGGFFQR